MTWEELPKRGRVGTDDVGNRLTVLRSFLKDGRPYCRVKFTDGGHEATIMRDSVDLDDGPA
jgi:hypothetical protein